MSEINTPLDHLRRLQLIEKINKTFREKYEWYRLLQVIKESKIPISENNNGCNIDLSKVPNEIIEKLEKILKMCEEKYKREREIRKSIMEARHYNISAP